MRSQLEGEIPDASRSWPDRGPGSSVPQLCLALQKAALGACVCVCVCMCVHGCRGVGGVKFVCLLL